MRCECGACSDVACHPYRCWCVSSHLRCGASSDVACNPHRCWCPSSHLTCGASSDVAGNPYRCWCVSSYLTCGASSLARSKVTKCNVRKPGGIQTDHRIFNLETYRSYVLRDNGTHMRTINCIVPDRFTQSDRPASRNQIARLAAQRAL
eukprot:scaffold65093_cov51-Phaeocystis_antarctica.AAC.2